MVLQHVAQRTRGVVITAAPFDADRLGDGDLHVIDVRLVPHRLEQEVGEAERHQVLHRLLPEIVIDAVDAVLVDDLADAPVDLAGGVEILAERLLQNHTRLRGQQAVRGELVGNRIEEFGRGGEVEGTHPVEPVGDRGPQAVPSDVAACVEPHEAKPVEEAHERRLVEPLGRHEAPQRVGDLLAEPLDRVILPRHADDPGRVGEGAVAVAQIERWKQFAVGEVTRPAEDDQIERIDGDDPTCHGALCSTAIVRDPRRIPRRVRGLNTPYRLWLGRERVRRVVCAHHLAVIRCTPSVFSADRCTRFGPML